MISIDPGKHWSWWAHFEGGELVNCGRVKMESGAVACKFFTAFAGEDLAIEKPMIRKAGRFGNARPSDILDLAVRVGWCESAPWGLVTEYLPNEWKGNTPKEISNQRTLNALSEREHLVVHGAGITKSLLHNLLDAVGIGLHHLKRTNER